MRMQTTYNTIALRIYLFIITVIKIQFTLSQKPASASPRS